LDFLIRPDAKLQNVSGNYDKQRMKQYLTKQNRKTIDFVLIEVDGKLIFCSEGKVGKSGIAKSTLNAGSSAKAIKEVKLQVQQLLDSGFVITELPKNIVAQDIVFDKAKWHINKDFPKDLDQQQSYVHSGVYICWLIDNGLFEADFKAEHLESINKLMTRKITPSKFYIDQLDGVFDAEGLTQEAIEFTNDYFDFEKGKYINDYTETLDPDNNLPSLFHIADSWNNYDKMKPIINKRLAEWKKNNSR